MGRLKNSLREGVALRFLHITIIILVAGSVVLAVDWPQGSNSRRLPDQPEINSSPSKGQGQGQGNGHSVPIAPNNKTDATATNNTSLTPPHKNINPANAAEKENGTSSNKEKLPQGSKNGTKHVPENPQGPQSDNIPQVDDQHKRKDPPPSATAPPPPDKNTAPIEKKGDSDADPKTKKSPVQTDKDKDKDKDSSRNSLYPQGCEESHSCSDEKEKMVACLRAPGNEMQELSLLIQNKGEDSLQVDIKVPAFLKIDSSNLTLGKEKSKSVQVSIIDQASRNWSVAQIVINGGNGDCLLDVPNQLLNSPYKQRFFEGFSYSAIITPMFGVYLLLFTVLAIGGSWMCCKLRGKRRHGDGIRYQELEMNLPESTLPITAGGKPEAENMDGWDEVWDDSWEDAEAARSSSRPMESLSSKGLAARKSNKDGWDNTWDD